MTPAHHRAAEVAAKVTGAIPSHVEAMLTWGPTVVVKVRVDDETVFLKAGANQNVHTEATVMAHARRAGVPTAEVLDLGTDDLLPGGRWMLTRAVPGRTLDVSPSATTLDDIARCYTLIHRVKLPGFGPFAADGQRGALDRWSQWQRQTSEEALANLVDRDAVEPGFVSRVRDLAEAFADDLDRAPGVLLHADLGGGETHVDPATGKVTALTDWGSSLVGDPLYDLVRFCGGGPSDDERPAKLHPRMHAGYFARNEYDPAHANRMMAFYRFHICVVEAAWGEDYGWAPGHVAWAERLIAELTP